MRSEEDLIRTLRTAAGHAGSDGLASAVAARRRVRRVRQRIQMVLAAAAVVVVAGATAAVLSRGGEQVRPAVTVTAVPATPTPKEAVVKQKIRPAAEVWPEAVFTMPAKSADGWRYRPVTGLSATEVLLSAESSFEKAGRLEVYDSAAKSARVLGDVPAPEGVKGYFVQDFEVGEQHIAWYGTTPNSPDKWADFWIMPRVGGQAKRVGEVTGPMSEVDRIGVTGDSVVWSVHQGGVYRMPLTGGTPERVADELHLMSWPLAVGYADGGENRGRRHDRVVDLETGQTVTVPAPAKVTSLTCGPVWCYGAAGDRTIVQRHDGSDRKDLPAEVRMHGMTELLGDRFALLTAYRSGDPAKEYVPLAATYDPVTGLMGGMSRMPSDGGGAGFGRGISSSPSTIVYWDEDVRSSQVCTTKEGAKVCEAKELGGGKEFTVLNVAAVTPGD
ncbi:hypothetical protein [Nonomuraea indica]|uniref:Uncharacterized protein n=1 Tax=Nonomuraea indica TaxID=1581193 RepID=A0ABW7ZVV3_9ACTN